jgi:hypothetical protein
MPGPPGPGLPPVSSRPLKTPTPRKPLAHGALLTMPTVPIIQKRRGTIPSPPGAALPHTPIVRTTTPEFSPRTRLFSGVVVSTSYPRPWGAYWGPWPRPSSAPCSRGRGPLSPVANTTIDAAFLAELGRCRIVPRGPGLSQSKAVGIVSRKGAKTQRKPILFFLPLRLCAFAWALFTPTAATSPRLPTPPR